MVWLRGVAERCILHTNMTGRKYHFRKDRVAGLSFMISLQVIDWFGHLGFRLPFGINVAGERSVVHECL